MCCFIMNNDDYIIKENNNLNEKMKLKIKIKKKL